MGWFQSSIVGLPPFLIYLCVGGLLTVIFATVYVRLTPYDEFALIRSGNVAAALGCGGNMIGFSIPLDRVIAQSANIADCALWALIAAIVQWLVYVLIRLILKDLPAEIAKNNLAAGVILASMAIVAGMLNSASMAL